MTTNTVHRNASYRAIGGPTGHLARLEPFDGNSLRGADSFSDWSQSYGRMPGDEVSKVRALIEEHGDPRFVVYSYATPIAFVFGDDTVYVPDTKYSATTSRGQTLCRAWLARQAYWHNV